MITNQNALPTVFAMSLGESTGLILEMKSGLNHIQYSKKMERMRAFQQMSVTCSLEDSMIAYHGIDLTEEQNQALSVVYKSTKPWMLGHVVGVLLDKLNNPKLANKDFAESVKVIVEQLTQKEGSNGNSPTKGLIVRLAEFEK